jgi:hypothetical protein
MAYNVWLQRNLEKGRNKDCMKKIPRGLVFVWDENREGILLALPAN